MQCLLRRHTAASTTASVWRRGREATGAELLFLRGCEGANMQASTGAGKVKRSGARFGGPLSWEDPQ
jgi:hypothetical protein